MYLSVLIPTYRRPDALHRCLNGLLGQQRKANQIIVVTRADDDGSSEVVSKWATTLPVAQVLVDRAGVVQALNRGLMDVRGDVVTITDDDAIAHPDWLERIERHFCSNPGLAGVGGRDIIHEGGMTIPATAPSVGLIAPFGRVIGNHHIGLGVAREVDHLKGVNMSWRMVAVGNRRFDTDLRGEGAQVHFELAFSLELKRRGWRIIYDPAVIVDHYPAPRFDCDQRSAPSLQAIEDASFNLYLSLLRYLPSGWKRQAALVWARVIGSSSAPGVARRCMYFVKNDPHGKDLGPAASRAWNAAKSIHREQLRRQ